MSDESFVLIFYFLWCWRILEIKKFLCSSLFSIP
jgi:hypothetical protein